jgi:hypothetical protein
MTTVPHPLSVAELRRFLLFSAEVGAIFWVGAVLQWQTWQPAILLLAALVLVPLGLAVVTPRLDPVIRWWRLLVWLHLPAALCLVGSFALTPGPFAGAAAIPWLAYTLLVALAGLGHLLAGGWRSLSELCIAAGLVYLAVGGGWMVLTRWGLEPLGFTEPLVWLTAMHFHYAGFVLPLLTGKVAEEMGNAEGRVASLGVVAGVPLVAAGITLTHFGQRGLELAAAWLLSTAGALVAVLHLWLAGRSTAAWRRWLLSVTGLSLGVGMVFSALYAWGQHSGGGWPDLAAMAPVHGAVNAFGFALTGLVAWNVWPHNGLGRRLGDAPPESWVTAPQAHGGEVGRME